MGNRQNAPESTTQLISIDTFNHANQNSDLNNIYQSRLSKSSATKYLIHKVISFTESSDVVTRYLALLQKIGRKVECPNLYLPVLCHVKQSEVSCANYQMLNLYFQNYNIRMRDQIQARRVRRQRFSQEQVWYIVYSIIKGIRAFQKVSISSGNLKTDKILLNDKGHLKLINILSQPQDQNSHYLSENQKIKRFFAPEQLRAMRQRIDKTINANIAQTFAIGIIILQLTTFIDGNRFYDAQRLTLNDYELKKADQMLASSYSKLLYNLTRTMLSGQYDRPLPSQIYSVFVPYQDKILMLRPFNFQPLSQMPNHMGVSNASLMSL